MLLSLILCDHIFVDVRVLGGIMAIMLSFGLSLNYEIAKWVYMVICTYCKVYKILFYAI